MKYNRLLLFVLLLFSTPLFSQTIFLRSGAIRLEKNISTQTLDSFLKRAPGFSGQTFGVIQFDEIPTPEQRTFLANNGIELLDYLPQNAYTVALKQNTSETILKTVNAKAIFQLKPQQKMQDYFARGLIPAYAVKVAGTVDVWISFYKTLDGNAVLQQLEELNADILSTDHLRYQIIAVRIAANRINEFAALPFVEYIQPAPPKDQPLNYNSRVLSRATLLNAPVANGGRGLNGEGVVVGHGDNADLQAHADFGQLINRNASPFSAHGVHTGATITGAGNINELYRGYAPKATLLSQSFSGIIDNVPTYVQDYGMVITNNSYGNIIECEYHGLYDLSSRILDQQALEFPSLLHVFSAGNSGLNTCGPYPTGYRTVLGGYQAAKNIVTVGATSDSGLVTGFSSRGPVRDGRIKPEIMAMGQWVISAWPTNSYSFNNGTSMSAPAVSGGLALLYQRYRQLNGGADPKNGLMKALLCNGGMDRGTAGPDFQYGFGVMNLLRSVEMLEGRQYVEGNSTHNGTTTHAITVPAGTAQLRVLLYWNDLPASIVSTRNLVNDLDLEVVDPSGNVVLPKVLDTAINSLGNAAVNGADHVNNIEQVVINTPGAGTYTLRIRGTTVSNTQQEYFVVYDPVPVSLKVTAPASDMALVPEETTKISWDSYGLMGTATLEFSADGGATWVNIAPDVDVARTVYTWKVPSVATHHALVRITKNGTGETSVSNPFVIIGQPAVSLEPVQCEDYIAINWTAVQGAADYEVMLLRGGEMKPVAITTNTSYAISGLSADTTYFVSVRARVNGIPGRRAVAISRQPNSGTCTGAISDNDVKMNAILSPRSGRKETSTELGAAETIRVRIKNLDDAPVSNFAVSYTINGGAPVTETVNATVAGGATYTHNFVTPVDLSASGSYVIKTFVKNSGDNNPVNDTLTTLVKQIANPPLQLNNFFVDNLETAEPATYQRDTLGIAGAERYDFSRTTPFGRLRTTVNSGVAASGTKAFTLDASRLVPTGNINYLYGTFNLRDYNTATNDLRLDFLYRDHGQTPNPANRVWVRGSDTASWIEAYNLDSNRVEEGVYKRVRSIEVSNLLQAAGQSFTTSFQVRWGQWGQWPAIDAENAAGYTLDDIRLYQVFNDVQMVRIDSPAVNNCGLPAARIVVSVRNSSNAAITNVPVHYRINNGSLVSETIASIPAKTTVQYTFTATANLVAFGNYTLQAVVDVPNDSFRENDTVSKVVYNQPLVTSFPYLQNFESGNGNFYTGGRRSSWEYGTPNSRRISGAASGAKAWKTGLEGTYNDKEHSFLYSPCFDLSGLAAPTLSFSMALDIEDCGNALCDAAWVEYSTDGIEWRKLGASGEGTNWYNKAAPRNLWSIQNYTVWRVATQALPAGLSRLRLRWVMFSDPGLTREGIAIDDVHIYDNPHGIYEGPTLTAPVIQAAGGNNWVHFTAGGKLVASVQPQNQSLGNTSVQAFINEGTPRIANNQYYVDRNITIKSTNAPTDSVAVRFYFLDKEVDTLLKATGCPGCAKPASAYALGVTQYTDPDKAVENGSLADNQQGLWNFLRSPGVAIVPFDKGYYAEYKVATFSEFWLNSGGVDGSTPLPVKLMDVTATRQGANAVINWRVGSETSVLRYEIEVARNASALQQARFDKIGEVTSAGNTTTLRSYSFADTEADKFGTRYYRLKIVNSDGSFRYSPVRSVSFEEAVVWQVYPNPSRGVFSLVYQLPAGQNVSARLFDVKGSLVKEISSKATGFLQKLNIDISANNYATGVYLLRVLAGEREQIFKLYKQ